MFVHLHVHSTYSLLNASARLESLIQRARDERMPALALTDHGNLFGAITFYRECLKKGVKPILGAQVEVVPDRLDRSVSHREEIRDTLILLCRTMTGWRNLIKIVSIGYMEGAHGSPRIDYVVLAQYSKGLIALSGGRKGGVGRLIQDNKIDAATTEARRLQKLYADAGSDHNFYLELQRGHGLEEEKVNRETVRLAHQLDIPLVATQEIHFLDEEDRPAYDALLCIGSGKTLYATENSVERAYPFASVETMQRYFADIPEALENTLVIAKRCNLLMRLGTPILPDFQPPRGESLDSWLRAEAGRGLRNRFELKFELKGGGAEHSDPLSDLYQVYQKRLDLELKIIIQMGFSGYFLIVSDFVRWAKKASPPIPVGPGRGSGAGSLVAWSLDITDIDPIRYELLFERFLNPERISMPDFDIDFCMDRRDEVIAYVQKKYGADRVAQIITFGTLQAKAAIRDVGRVMEIPYGRVDQIAKLVPNVLGISLQEAIHQEPALQKQMQEDPEIESLIQMAKALEGVQRSAGTHAAGIVIANGPLTDTAPLYKDPNDSNDPNATMPAIQFNMMDVERVGLVKFDFLGLKTLTVIDHTIQMIHKTLKTERPIRIEEIDLADAKTYQLLKEGRTTGVFQLESSGMKMLLKKLLPDLFEDIVALVALYRPGPLGSGMVDDFIERKHGKVDVVYPLPQLESILHETYGVILYQEQVMRIAQTVGGYSLGGADILRRAMGKKKPEEMARQRTVFLEGAHKNRIDPETASHLFDLMEKFAGYGFNKSHSVAYAMISYQTAWLKAHYPVPFLAATLTCDMSQSDKVFQFIQECRAMNVTLYPPDINNSEPGFTVAGGGGDGIRFGLAAIKGVGVNAARAIVDARQQGAPFSGIFDLCRRIETGKINRRVLESLIKAGACDAFSGHRAALLAGVSAALERGTRQREEELLGYLSLFSMVRETGSASTRQEQLPETEQWNDRERLTFEKEALGFYLSGHPLQRYEEELVGYGLETIDALNHGNRKKTGSERETQVSLAGILNERKVVRVSRGKRSGERMAFLTLEDLHGQVDVTLFSETYTRYRDLLEKEKILVVVGTVEERDDEASKIIADQIFTLDGYRQEVCRSMQIEAQSAEFSEEVVSSLEQILSDAPQGRCRIIVRLRLPDCHVVIALGERYSIQPGEQIREKCVALFGEEAVCFHKKLS